MPVKLRLKRQGRKNLDHFSIVASDSRSPRDGRFIEKIGFYDPVSRPARVYIDHDAAMKWLQHGAQPTNTVYSMLRHAGVILKWALTKQERTEEEFTRIYGAWREAKDKQATKVFISVDVNSQPLEPIPTNPVYKPKKKKVSKKRR